MITIITIVRNGRHILEQTVLSVINQSYQNIEYIIIDGASTDGTLDIIKQYEDKIAYWISEPDRGIYDAMNKGIDRATGDWINFMNAGDCFYNPDAVKLAFRSGCDNADLIYGHCRIVYERDSSVVWKAGTPKGLWKGMVFRHQSLFTRASVCREYRFKLEYKIGGDFDFIYRCHQGGLRFCRLDLIVASVTVGGLSDVNVMPGIRENRLSVLPYENRLKVNLYYGWQIVLAYVKNFLKKFMSKKLLKKARTIKYN